MSTLRTCPKCQCKSLESNSVRVWCLYAAGCGYSALHDQAKYAPGMRAGMPALCWRQLDTPDLCCIRGRGHDDGIHEPELDSDVDAGQTHSDEPTTKELRDEIQTWCDAVLNGDITDFHNEKPIARDMSRLITDVARLEGVEVKAKTLLDKLDEIIMDEQYKGVWLLNQVHNGEYTGPTYTAELSDLRATLTFKVKP